MQSKQGSETTQEIFSAENGLHTVLALICLFYVMQM